MQNLFLNKFGKYLFFTQRLQTKRRGIFLKTLSYTKVQFLQYIYFFLNGEFVLNVHNIYFKLVQSDDTSFRTGLSCLKREELATMLVSPHQQGSSHLFQLVCSG